MVHRVEIYDKDEAGNVIDVIGARYYCTDICAKLDPDYDGWNGGSDLYDPVQCPCGELLEWRRWSYLTNSEQIVSPESPDYWEAQ
jgi:hypothetical protein